MIRFFAVHMYHILCHFIVLYNCQQNYKPTGGGLYVFMQAEL